MPDSTLQESTCSNQLPFTVRSNHIISSREKGGAMQSEVRILHGKRTCARQHAWVHMGLYAHHFQQKSVYISKSSNLVGVR